MTYVIEVIELEPRPVMVIEARVDAPKLTRRWLRSYPRSINTWDAIFACFERVFTRRRLNRHGLSSRRKARITGSRETYPLPFLGRCKRATVLWSNSKLS